MSAPSEIRSSPQSRSWRARVLVLALGWLALSPVGVALAGPIRADLARFARVRAAMIQPGSAWDRYFASALQMGRLDVQGPNAVRVLSAAPDGRLPDCAFVDYLRWRRDLNPARFDRFHATLGQMLILDQIARVDPPQVSGEVIGAIGTEVPEPSTLFGFAAVAALAWRFRRAVRGSR